MKPCKQAFRARAAFPENRNSVFPPLQHRIRTPYYRAPFPNGGSKGLPIQPQPPLPAMPRAKASTSCGQGNTGSLTLSLQKSAALLSCGPRQRRNRKKALKQECLFKIPGNGVHRRKSIPFRMPYPESGPHRASGGCPHPDRPASPLRIRCG